MNVSSEFREVDCLACGALIRYLVDSSVLKLLDQKRGFTPVNLAVKSALGQVSLGPKAGHRVDCDLGYALPKQSMEMTRYRSIFGR